MKGHGRLLAGRAGIILILGSKSRGALRRESDFDEKTPVRHSVSWSPPENQNPVVPELTFLEFLWEITDRVKVTTVTEPIPIVVYLSDIERLEGWHSMKNQSIGSMCYVIVTGRSLLWTLLSLAALMAVLSGLITPRWLVGPPTIKDTSKYFLFILSVIRNSRCTRSR